MSENTHSHTHNHNHDHGHDHGHSHSHDHGHNHGGGDSGLMTKFAAPAVSFLMLACGMICSHLDVPFFSHTITRLIWYVIAFLPVGVPVAVEAWESIIRDHDFFNEFTLMVIACIGAFCIGEFPEAVGVMLFYTIGETLQDMAVDKATHNISRLLDVRGEHASVIRDGKTVDVKPQEVAVGETIVVRPGERVPLDGVLVGKEALFDTAALTGESLPQLITPGSEVLAGMISSDSTVSITTNRPYGESTLSRILEMVRDASGRKAHAELFIRKFAHVYTPCVILLALLIVLVPWIVSLVHPAFDFVFSEWLYRALVFLVISCPCALVISVPLGYFAGIGAASRLGILFKGGNYLEAITKVNEVAFDKTGTLTTGRFSVECVSPAHSSGDDFLRFLAAAEQDSSHPLAKAVVEYAIARGIQIPSAGNIREFPGYGSSADVDGHAVIAGNLRLLDREGVSYPEDIVTVDSTVIACAVDGRYAGHVLLGDTVKEDAVEAVRDLHRLGIRKIVMLSGDKPESVAKYARKLGISEFHGGMLPQDKAEYVGNEAAREGSSIAFVGDGMNDAPVLALSNVGIAMGGLGSDAAIESADVVIQTDRPSRVATAIRIGRKTHAIVMENIIGAISIKVLILVLGALGIASLWAAVFADVGVALLAVLNSLRIMKYKAAAV